ncbi:MAG: hypothetical protein K6T86_15935 [Pirellulales bacterium]|nr:hypothetical protein [Pirellulales bacterium]
MSEWLQITQTLGVPVAVMGAMAYALWRAARWAAPEISAYLRETRATQVGIERTLQALLASGEARAAQQLDRLEDIDQGVQRVEAKLGRVEERICDALAREDSP